MASSSGASRNTGVTVAELSAEKRFEQLLLYTAEPRVLVNAHPISLSTSTALAGSATERQRLRSQGARGENLAWRQNGFIYGLPRASRVPQAGHSAVQGAVQSSLGTLLVLAALAIAGPALSQGSLFHAAFDCIVEPAMLVKVASPVVGVVSQVEVDRGDFVHREQVVAKLEDAVEEANVALARERTTNDSVIELQKARLGLLRSKRVRAERLRTNAYVSEAAFEEAETEARVADQQVREAEHNLKIARLELKRSEEALKQRTIRSPIDGVVVERLLVPGEYRNEHSPLMTLAQINPLRVEVLVPTSFFGQIRPGTKAQVRPEKPVGGSYEATVTVVDRVLDSGSGTFGIRLELPNPEHKLPAGLRCQIEFDRDPASGADTAQTDKRS